MEAGARATIDDPILRPRMRRDFVQPNYIRRNVPRPQPALLSDITVRRPVPSPNFSPQVDTATRAAGSEPQQHVNQESQVYNSVVSPAITASEHINSPALSTLHKPRLRLLIHALLHPRLREHLKLRGRSKLQVSLIALAVAIVLLGGYVSFLGLRANHVAVVQAAKLTQQANNAAKSSGSSTVPSTVKPSAAAVANYVVAPDLPRYIIIPKLDVDAEVRSVGLTSSGALGVPDNVYYTDWYNESALPGQQGAMLIDGHVSSWAAHGVFYGIKTLVAGDIIKIERGDGTIFTYSVVSSQVYPSGNVNMTSAMTPVVAGQPGLNLITCTGDVIPGTSQFNERIVVYATLQQP